MLIKELTHTLEIPEGVNVDCSSSDVKITGPRGELSRNFEHPNINFKQGDSGLQIIGKNQPIKMGNPNPIKIANSRSCFLEISLFKINLIQIPVSTSHFLLEVVDLPS